ncbi:mariner Mos1 transposase [Trichonephila clavipes]|nr:mariner Mos1 transposase [Trichonephila clavipes]
MGIPYHPGMKATVYGMATHNLSRQGKSQTNSVKAQDYGNSVLGPVRCFLVVFLPQGTTINSCANDATLRKLRRALQNKRCGILSKGVLLLHDSAMPHPSRETPKLKESFGWEVLDHAPYSPDLALSDFHLFRYLKHSFGRKHFSDNEEVKAAMNYWLSKQAAEFFEEGFYN